MPKKLSSVVNLKSQSDDLFQLGVTAVTLARDVSNMAACQPAAAAASVVLLILDTVQKVKVNQEACARLARRCANILVDLDTQMTGRWESAPQLLVKNLEKFRETLGSIYNYMKLQTDVSWHMRLAKKGTVEDALVEFDDLLSEASRRFQISTLIDIHYTVSRRKKTLENIHENMYSNSREEGLSSASETQTLTPLNRDSCLSFQEQPCYSFQDYVRPDIEKGPAQPFRQYRLSDIHIRPPNRTLKRPGWWEGVEEADTKDGEHSLMKRYERDGAVHRKQWLRDVAILRYLYHPQFPQLLASSLKNSPVPFILLAHTTLRCPQEAILDCLHSTSLEECSYLVLHFFHQLQDAVVYLQSRGLPPAAVQDFLDDASVCVERSDSILISLPASSEGHVATIRNHGLIESLRTLCLNMLPRTSEPKMRNDKQGDSLHELLLSVRHLLWTHHDLDDGIWSGAHPSRTRFEDECICRNVPHSVRPVSDWMGFHFSMETEEMGAWDFGYIPRERGMESFVKLGNVLKDELADYPYEEKLTGVRWMNGPERHENLPYQALPNRQACWTVDVPSNTRTTGLVTHTAQVSEESAWQFLLRWGEVLAQEFGLPLQDLRVVTSVEHKLHFDVSYYDVHKKWDNPPMTMYMFTSMSPERTPYLSHTPHNNTLGAQIPQLEPEWTCTIQVGIGDVRSVAITRPETARLLSSSPTPSAESSKIAHAPQSTTDVLK